MMIRRTLFLLSVILLQPLVVFGQIETVLQGLSVSIDNLQKATVSAVSAAENLTEAFRYIQTSGAQRFLWYTEKNLKESLEEISVSKTCIKDSATEVSENILEDLDEFLRTVYTNLDAIEEHLNKALTSVGEARDAIHSDKAKEILMLTTPSLEQALLGMSTTMEYIDGTLSSIE